MNRKSTIATISVVSASSYFLWLFLQSPAEYVPEPPLGQAPILMVMAGNESGREIFIDQMEDSGLRDYMDFGYQINGPSDRMPEDFAPGEAYQIAYDITSSKLQALDISKYPEPFVHVFYDYEPQMDGTHWMLRVMRDGYTEADIGFINQSMLGVRDAAADHGAGKLADDCAFGFYYLPRQTRKGPYTDALIEKAFTFQGAKDAQDLIWVNAYPPSSGAIPDEWTESRLVTAWNISREYAPESAIAFWPRWSIDNKLWIDEHLAVAYSNGFEMDRVILWVNPHSDFMASMYARWTLEAEESLKLFVWSEYQQRGW